MEVGEPPGAAELLAFGQENNIEIGKYGTNCGTMWHEIWLELAFSWRWHEILWHELWHEYLYEWHDFSGPGNNPLQDHPYHRLEAQGKLPFGATRSPFLAIWKVLIWIYHFVEHEDTGQLDINSDHTYGLIPGEWHEYWHE